MFINNLGECATSFYLGECNNCNYCIIETRIRVLDMKLERQEQELYMLERYNILSLQEKKEYLIDLFFIKQKINLLKKELQRTSEL